MAIPAAIAEDFDREWWRAQAACHGKDPDIFFPGALASLDEARAICAECPVKEPCGEYAITHYEDHGVWGGLSERQRRRIRARGRAS